MLENWQSFLLAQGATIENNCVSAFSTLDKEIEYSNNSSIVSDLSSYSLIKITGSDATSFLQGQLSNDITHVTNNQSQMSAYCSPKGRTLALFRIFRMDEAYYLNLPGEITDQTISRLKMFIMRSDVSIDDVTEQYFHFGVAGKNATENISQALQLSVLPTNTDEAIVKKNMSVQKLSGSPTRYELFGRYDDAITVWNKLAADCHPVGQPAWNLQRINAGIPDVVASTTDTFVPQMLNLQLINVLNFKKGCYPGQEIVARTKYLGKLKKRLYLAEINTQNSISIGDDLYESGENQQSVGKIVLAAPSSNNAYHILAVLRISATENQPIYLSEKTGPAIKLLEIPYSLEEEKT